MYNRYISLYIIFFSGEIMSGQQFETNAEFSILKWVKTAVTETPICFYIRNIFSKTEAILLPESIAIL